MITLKVAVTPARGGRDVTPLGMLGTDLLTLGANRRTLPSRGHRAERMIMAKKATSTSAKKSGGAKASAESKSGAKAGKAAKK